MILKILSLVFIPLLTLFIVWGLGWVWFAAGIAMKKEHTPKATQAIVVLTGGNGRIHAGLDLLIQNKAPKLFISGVNKDVTKQDIFDSWKNPTQNQPCCVSLGYKSTDTVSNAREVEEWVKENNIKSFILVTSGYHMPRASMEVKSRLKDIEIIEYPVLSDDFTSWHGKFWTLTFNEYNKTLIRYMQMIKP